MFEISFRLNTLRGLYDVSIKSYGQKTIYPRTNELFGPFSTKKMESLRFCQKQKDFEGFLGKMDFPAILAENSVWD